VLQYSTKLILIGQVQRSYVELLHEYSTGEKCSTLKFGDIEKGEEINAQKLQMISD